MAAWAVVCVAVAGCGGGESKRQDAKEPEGTYRVEVAKAEFPASQSIAESSVLRLQVRNADTKAVPNVAVTIQTKAKQGGAPQAFAQDTGDPNLADPSRPIWILDEGPKGGETAHTNTWALGRLPAGATKTFEWKLTAVKAGDYTVDYSVSPGLNGKAKPAAGAGTGSFRVSIDDTPPAARVADDGETVVREPGEEDSE